MRHCLAALVVILLLGMMGGAPPLVGRAVAYLPGDGCPASWEYIVQRTRGGEWIDVKWGLFGARPQPGEGISFVRVEGHPSFKACCRQGEVTNCTEPAQWGSGPAFATKLRTVFKGKEHRAGEVADWNTAHAGG